MEHADALELIEQSALEPGGLDRLISGDTLESAALAGHLAGCEACAAVLTATRRTAEALRLVAAETPSPDLRERTLGLVAAVGRPRGGAAGAGGEPSLPAGGVAAPVGRRRVGLLALVAAVSFALLAAGSFVAADLQGQLDRTRQEANRLRELYSEVESLLLQPTTRLVALRSEDGTVEGSLIVDPASNRMAVMTDELPAPATGTEYRCWVELAGIREPVGRMWFEGGLAYWAGTNEGIAAWPAGTVIGVSLEPVDDPASEPAVLSGEL